jgi:hypothetical protein
MLPKPGKSTANEPTAFLFCASLSKDFSADERIETFRPPIFCAHPPLNQLVEGLGVFNFGGELQHQVERIAMEFDRAWMKYAMEPVHLLAGYSKARRGTFVEILEEEKNDFLWEALELHS